MTNNCTQWTKKEFLVYLTLYAANANGNISAKEQKIICSKAGTATYEKMLEQFKTHNDHECIQNIVGYKEKYFDTADGVQQIIQEMTNVFFSDSKIANEERQILNLVGKLLK